MKRAIYVLIFILSILILDSSINAWSEYTIGQEVEYNGIKFYVIKDSSTLDDSVTMLKKEPLSPNEVTLYGGEHINRYAQYNQGRVCDNNGYGGIAFYSSSTCTFGNYDPVYDGCTTNYAESDIKYIVDSWSQDKVGNGLVEARLLTMDDLVNNLGCDHAEGVVSSATGTLSSWHIDLEYTPIWVYSRDYSYWTMSPVDDSSYRVWGISYDGYLDRNVIFSSCGAVRPVIKLQKSAIEIKEDEQIVPDNNEIVQDDEDSEVNNKIVPEKKNDKKTESSIKVIVENTYMRTSMIIIILGFISAGLGIFAYYKFSNKKK